MLECVVNISEGRHQGRLAALAAAAGPDLLDVHADPHHHRSVFTLVGERAPRSLTIAALERLDLRDHEGVHPRLGVVDVVPFVPLEGASLDDALAARDAFAHWLGTEHGVPCFLYGPERTLPDLRRQAFAGLAPEHGPSAPHPTAGATAVGARPALVAYNVWLATPDVARARSVATTIRGPDLRALGLPVGDRVQVSMNLIAPARIGPAQAYDRVVAALGSADEVAEAELVGLVPESVVAAVDEGRWAQLGLSAERTIESRLARRDS